MNKLQKINKENNTLLLEVESKLDFLVKGQENYSNKLEGIGNDLRKDFIGLALRNEELLKSNHQLKQQLDEVLKESTIVRQLSQEYREYQKKFNWPTLSKRFDTLKFSQVRFKELARDPNARTKVYHKKTVDEAKSALQAEIMGIVEGVERIPQPYFKKVDLDFHISGPAPYSHLDLKHPVGSAILKKQGRNIKLKTMAFDLGEIIFEQKNRFCGLEQGPRSSRNVLHIVDLCYVPKNEK